MFMTEKDKNKFIADNCKNCINNNHCKLLNHYAKLANNEPSDYYDVDNDELDDIIDEYKNYVDKVNDLLDFLIQTKFDKITREHRFYNCSFFTGWQTLQKYLEDNGQGRLFDDMESI